MSPSSIVQVKKRYTYEFMWNGNMHSVKYVTSVPASVVIDWFLTALKLQNENKSAFCFSVAESRDYWMGNKIVPFEGFGKARLVLRRIPTSGTGTHECSCLVQSPQPKPPVSPTKQESPKIRVSYENVGKHTCEFPMKPNTSVQNLLSEYLQVRFDHFPHRIADLQQEFQS